MSRSWLGRRQGQAVEFLRVEKRVLRARLGPRRLRFTDAEPRVLAEAGRPLGRSLLAEVASLATPETILRWYRESVATKYDGSRSRSAAGSQTVRGESVKQLLAMARAHLVPGQPSPIRRSASERKAPLPTLNILDPTPIKLRREPICL
jgi:hypothetical protein